MELLASKTRDYTVVNYLQNPPSTDELRELIGKLGITPEDLLRKNEELYKEKFKNQKFSDDEWIEILHQNPILIERPIIVNGNKARVCRPPELIHEIFES
jgi:arsenate reductase